MKIYRVNAVRAYRLINPESRAIRHYELTRSSGNVRRATCIFCRVLIDSESSKYQTTKHFSDAIEGHYCKDMVSYHRAYARMLKHFT